LAFKVEIADEGGRSKARVVVVLLVVDEDVDDAGKRA